MCDEEDVRGHGLARVATVGIDDDAVATALELAEAHDEVYAIVGRHPNSATGFEPSDLEPIRRAAAHPKVVAIGETGLDYYRDHAPHDDQRARLRSPDRSRARARQAARDPHARGRGRHARDARRARGGSDGRDALLLGGRPAGRVRRARLHVLVRGQRHLSRRRPTCRTPLRACPTTCCSWRPTRRSWRRSPCAGKQNAPANVVHTARKLAELRGVSYDDLEQLVERNAARVFGW